MTTKNCIYGVALIVIMIFSHVTISPYASGDVLSERDIAPLYIIDSYVNHIGTDAAIRKVTDGTTVYILKQIHDESPYEQCLLINDCIASTMGCDAGIPVNEVFFIPCNVGSALKIYPGRAATLHSYAPGKDLQQQMPPFLKKEFRIQQRVIDPHSIWQKQYPLSEKGQGITKTILKHMGYHPDFAKLVAFDMFVGNSDRSAPNIFYDSERHAVVGIDHAAAFSKKLALFAYDRVAEYIQDGYFQACPVSVITNLRIFRDTLRNLCEKNKPNTIIRSLMFLSDYSGTDADKSAIMRRIEFQASVIETNYQYSIYVLELLDQILLD